MIRGVCGDGDGKSDGDCDGDGDGDKQAGMKFTSSEGVVVAVGSR